MAFDYTATPQQLATNQPSMVSSDPSSPTTIPALPSAQGEIANIATSLQPATLRDVNLKDLSHPTIADIIQYPGLSYWTFQLSNGLRAHLAHMPEAVGVSSALVVKAGTRMEAEHESGLAHFVEHYTCSGTATFPSYYAVQNQIANLGAVFNAHTDRDYIWYEAFGPEETAQQVLELLSEIACAPILNSAHLDEVREGVLTDMASIISDPYRVFTEIEMPQALFPGCSFSRSILGGPETVASFTTEQVQGYHKHYFVPNNMELFVAGHLPFEIASRIENLFRDQLHSAHVKETLPAASSVWDQPNSERLLIEAIADPQVGAAVLVNYPLNLKPEQVAAAELFCHILTGNGTSQLTNLLCHQQAITREVVSTVQHYYREFNVATIALQLNNAQLLPGVVKSIQQTLSDLAEAGPTPQSLIQASRAGNFECQKLLRQPDKMVDYMISERQRCGFVHPYEMAKALREVTVSDVKEIATKFKQDQIFLGLIGGLDKSVIGLLQRLLGCQPASRRRSRKPSSRSRS